MKDRRILFACKVSALPAPPCDCRCHSPDELAHAGLTLGATSFSVEVFRGNNIRRRHRPALRDFDVLLLENDVSGFTGDRRSPILPLDGVVRRDPLAGKIAAKFETFFWLC